MEMSKQRWLAIALAALLFLVIKPVASHYMHRAPGIDLVLLLLLTVFSFLSSLFFTLRFAVLHEGGLRVHSTALWLLPPVIIAVVCNMASMGICDGPLLLYFVSSLLVATYDHSWHILSITPRHFMWIVVLLLVLTAVLLALFKLESVNVRPVCTTHGRVMCTT